MAAHTVRIRGTLNGSQCWPGGDSDADTLRVRVVGNAVRVVEDGSKRERVTRAFDGARVIGRGVHPAIDSNGFVRVRLQGVDAPELHYMPVADGVHVRAVRSW